MTIRRTLLTAMAAITLSTWGQPALHAADTLTIGSKAPALDVEHWIHAGDGKFEPVTKFEAGKVYVVEFWATWCGPCIASMPHLAELQKEYADKGVRIVSISDEDLETVEKFLERKVQGGGDETYRELTKAWSLTTDPDQSTYNDYMVAARQGGIPTSFVVGKDSKIEWIGHPMNLDKVLEEVVSGKWDREAFKSEFAMFALLEQGEFDAALSKIDELLKKKDDVRLRMLKLQVLVQLKKLDAATETLKELYAKGADDPGLVDMVAWNFYEMASNMDLLDEEMINMSIEATEAAIKKADKEMQSSMLDTQAHYLFAKGDIDKAIAAEEKAISLGEGPNREFYENFLKELKEAKAKKEAGK